MTEEQRIACAERNRARWRDPEWRAREIACRRERMRRMHQDPTFKARHSARVAELNRRPDVAEKHAAHCRKMNADPANAERSARLQRERVQDPQRRAEYAVYALKGMLAQHGVFYIPPGMLNFYKKLKKSIGTDAARDAIRQIECERFARLADYGAHDVEDAS